MKLHQSIRSVAMILLVLLPAQHASAAELYASSPSAVQDSLLLSARPGEYYYNLGADAVRHKDYAHAVEMYQVSASWAYKTSEYNLGVMYARGEGVAVDLPRAMAWMTLAAERSDNQYLAARDLIATQLDKNGLTHAEEILRGLLPTYGDTVALGRAKQRWHEVRNEATGSHLGYTGNVTVAGAGGNSAVGKSQLGAIEEHEMEKFMNPKLARPAGQSNMGTPTPADLVGTSGVDGAAAYADLRTTDNPYDPRLERGVAVVGPVRALDDPRKAAAPAPAPADGKKD